MASINTREIVLNILMEVLESKQYSHLVINAVLQKYGYLDKTQKSFIKIISEGTVENLIQIDYVINLYSKIKVKKMKPEIRNILRLSVFQILYLESVPDHSACDEAVKLTVATKKYKNLKGFVNGVLRNICREKETIEYPRLEIEYSIPEWIAAQWREQYGEEACSTIVRQFKNNNLLTIHGGVGIDVDKLKQELTNENVMASDAPYMDDALQISGFDSLTELESFKKGHFYVQDISSMFVGEIANPKEEDTVLDVCAAPGGKSILAAIKMNGKGNVISRDLTQKKVDLLNENITRLNLSNMKAEVHDATVLDESMVEKADIVICDVPCSGLGVIGKKSDIKYNVSEESQQELVKLQRNILATVYNYVKPGGTLVYSTCTTNKNENIGNVEWFLDQYGFKMAGIDEFLPIELQSETTKQGYIQLLPGVHQCDGFFICKMIRER